MADLVGVSEAARRLGVNKGTISKQVAAGAILNHAPEGQPPLIDMESVDRERDQNLDPTKRRTVKTAKSDAGTLTEAKTETAVIEAQRRRLQLAKELGQLLARDEVERAFEDLARKVRLAFERGRVSFVHEIAGLEPAEMAVRMEAREDEIFAALADELSLGLDLERPVPA